LQQLTLIIFRFGQLLALADASDCVLVAMVGSANQLA
jgi:hypothetical protein